MLHLANVKKSKFKSSIYIHVGMHFPLFIYLLVSTVIKCYGLQSASLEWSFLMVLSDSGLSDKKKRIEKSTAYMRFIFKEFIEIAILLY